MGLLRTLLALSVVLQHAYGLGFVRGDSAVQMFYVVSGFLISFVLTEAKTYKSTSAFYVNRYLRLWPIYAVIAILTLIALLFQPQSPFWGVYRAAPLSARLLLTFSNTFLFGQDWVMFSGVQNGHLLLVRFYGWSEPLLYLGLLAPQAWTLGVELAFYLVAPFVLPRRRWIYGLLALSLCLRLILVIRGLGLQDPWTYRFFPFELALFLAGALAHQVLLKRYRRLPPLQLSRCASFATYGLVVLCVVYHAIPLSDSVKVVPLLLIFTALVPLTFEYQKQHRFDRYIGNLSYPIYISHMLVLMGVTALFKRFDVQSAPLLTGATIAGSIGFAMVLERGVGLPLERVRGLIRRRASARDARWLSEAQRVATGQPDRNV